MGFQITLSASKRTTSLWSKFFLCSCCKFLVDSLFPNHSNLDSILKSRDITSPTNVRLVKAMVFPVFMYGWISWTIKKAVHWTEELVVSNWWLEKTLEGSLGQLDSREIKPVNPEGNQSWIFTGRTDAEAETPILWRPCAKSWLNGKDPDAGKD